MRISDWSSDVCSSDLRKAARNGGPKSSQTSCSVPGSKTASPQSTMAKPGSIRWRRVTIIAAGVMILTCSMTSVLIICDTGRQSTAPFWGRGAMIGSSQTRSEEHTSELQSLMRISYAVFCLKEQKELEDIQE